MKKTPQKTENLDEYEENSFLAESEEDVDMVYGVNLMFVMC